jgi:hypothetical protein
MLLLLLRLMQIDIEIKKKVIYDIGIKYYALGKFELLIICVKIRIN